MIGVTYVFPLQLLSTNSLDRIPHFLLCQELAIREYHLIKRPRVGHDPCDVTPNVVEVGHSRRHGAITENIFGRREKAGIDPARGEARRADLVPPAYVDGRVGEVELPDIVEDVLFL